MKQWSVGAVLLLGLIASTVSQVEIMRNRPVALKLGPAPQAKLLKLFAGDHAVTLALHTVTQVMFYFGSFFEQDFNRLQQSPSYVDMYQHLKSAVELDPYNLDAYYFAQASFTWEVGQPVVVNKMLDYGMKYRTWDYHLPFYAGFNAAYFLKDYASAARYYKIAAERSGNSLFTTLASRYFYEAGENTMALDFLGAMIKGSRDQKTRHIYEQRRDALLAVQKIEQDVAVFVGRFQRVPENLLELVEKGVSTALPADPYGGAFYLDDMGRVRSTSKFAFLQQDKPALDEQQSTDE